MNRNVVGLVWIGGLVLAIAVYLAGPDRILHSGVDAIEQARATVNDVLAAFAVNTYDVMRALTLGLLPAFVVLGVLAYRRGQRAIRAMVVVCVLFLMLLYQPATEGWYVSSTRWTIAFVVVAIGCAVMTRRLLDAMQLDARALPGAPAGAAPDGPAGPPPGSPWSRRAP